jgi:hypothetical protein
MEVADVDHGSDTDTPTAAQSAICAVRLRSKTDAIRSFVLNGRDLLAIVGEL